MENSATVATLLRVAFYFLNKPRLPPVEKPRESDIPMVLVACLFGEKLSLALRNGETR